MNEDMKAAWLEISAMLGEPTRAELDVFLRTWQRAVAARAEQPAQQEPVALKWQQTPIRTAWGDDMVVASVAIDNDHTLSLYCERDQAPKVDAMFAQRTWVGLTDEHRAMIQRGVDSTTPPFNPDWNTEAVLVEEMQRMAKRIEKLEATLERQTTRIVDLQTHIANLEGEE